MSKSSLSSFSSLMRCETLVSWLMWWKRSVRRVSSHSEVTFGSEGAMLEQSAWAEADMRWATTSRKAMTPEKKTEAKVEF